MEKSFSSSYGGGLLFAHQYLAELMCERQARSRSKELSTCFWRQPEWERAYAIQARFASALLKLYSADIILRVLRTKCCQNTYSLGAKWLHPLLKAELCRVTAQAAIPSAEPPQIPSPTNEAPRGAFVQAKSSLDKLREAESSE
jgi:hypothetical protein